MWSHAFGVVAKTALLVTSTFLPLVGQEADRDSAVAEIMERFQVERDSTWADWVSRGYLDSAELRAVRDSARARLARRDSLRQIGIDAFASVPWGADIAGIVAEWGSPGEQIEAGEMSSVLYYSGQLVLDEVVEMFFVVHEQFGLVKGGYFLERILSADKADRVFEKFAVAIGDSYPHLLPAVCSDGDCSGLSTYADAVRAATWHDLVNSSWAYVVFRAKGAGRFDLEVGYNSVWFGVLKGQETDRRF